LESKGAAKNLIASSISCIVSVVESKLFVRNRWIRKTPAIKQKLGEIKLKVEHVCKYFVSGYVEMSESEFRAVSTQAGDHGTGSPDCHKSQIALIAIIAELQDHEMMT